MADPLATLVAEATVRIRIHETDAPGSAAAILADLTATWELDGNGLRRLVITAPWETDPRADTR